ncbi:hypothetical protein SADO_12968 [Salinisphaera dokdonensis CL-ES53]|uniref:C-type lysozyme inhibitor domain-containing protein n=2 Tax=Salinisphaera TaxID=180541 RepID=A0ABV2B2S5_9GAMM
MLFIAFSAVLAGCGSEPDPNINVSGELVRNTEQALPANASARISMFEHRDGGGDKRIVAERSIHKVQGETIKFDLEIARNLIKPNEEYGLRAEVMAPEGDVLWQMDQPLRFKPLENSEGVKLELVKARQEMDLAFRKYRCEDGFHLSAVTNTDRAIVRLGNRRLVLPATQGGDSFVDEHDNRLKTETDERISFRVDGSEHTLCEPVPDQTPSQIEPAESAEGEGGDPNAGGARSTNEGEESTEVEGRSQESSDHSSGKANSPA